MNTLLKEPRLAAGEDVRVTADRLFVEFSNSRTITAPLAWSPLRLHGRPGNAITGASSVAVLPSLPNAWTTVSGMPVVVGNQFFVTNGPVTGTRYYRLRAP
jgi:hypothetical protein